MEKKKRTKDWATFCKHHIENRMMEQEAIKHDRHLEEEKDKRKHYGFSIIVS